MSSSTVVHRERLARIDMGNQLRHRDGFVYAIPLAVVWFGNHRMQPLIMEVHENPGAAGTNRFPAEVLPAILYQV